MRHPEQFATIVLVQQMRHQRAIRLDIAVAHTQRLLDMDGQQAIFQFLWMI